MKKKLIIAIVILAAAVLLWRLWPHSFSHFVSEESSVTALSSGVLIPGIENSRPVVDSYAMEISDPQSSELKAILGILATSRYRQDFRNLLPWGTSSISSGKDAPRTLTLVFMTGAQEEDSVKIQFCGSRTLAVDSGSGNKTYLYHPTDRTVLDRLTEYLKANGTKS